MKKLILFLAMILLPATGFAQSGTTGNLTWSLSGGTLTISGNGPMPDYSYGGSPWYNYRRSIAAMIIGNGVTSIGDWAFLQCYNLPSLAISRSVTSIGRGAFADCVSLLAINVDAGNSYYLSEGGVLFNKSKSSLLCYPAGKSDTYSIPNSVISIGDMAFRACGYLTSVTIPNSVTSIGEMAFDGCGLTSITIPTSVTSIGNAAFYGCNDLPSITVPRSVTNIGEDAFGDCDNLSAIIVDAGNSNYSSEDGILFNKSKKSLLCYPAGKSGAFSIPNSVTRIEAYAFNGCRRLTSVTISGSVTSIGRVAFQNCYGLTSATISGSVTSIEYGAFWDCRGLKDVTVAWAMPLSVSSDVFYYTSLAPITLHVPNGTKALYAAANVWKDFGTIMDGSTSNGVVETSKIVYADGILSVVTPQSELIEVYSVAGQLLYHAWKTSDKEIFDLSRLPSGVLIVRGSSGWARKVFAR
jgi:hypothetical protein